MGDLSSKKTPIVDSPKSNESYCGPVMVIKSGCNSIERKIGGGSRVWPKVVDYFYNTSLLVYSWGLN